PNVIDDGTDGGELYATFGEGKYFVTWRSSAATSGKIFGKFVDASTGAVGQLVQVAGPSAGSNGRPLCATAYGAGQFAVAWGSPGDPVFHIATLDGAGTATGNYTLPSFNDDRFTMGLAFDAFHLV